MGTVHAIPSYFESSEAQLFHGKGGSRSRGTKQPSVLGWYQILRAHYHWPLFQAVRYALWLAR